jgi:hypothetical protein
MFVHEGVILLLQIGKRLVLGRLIVVSPRGRSQDVYFRDPLLALERVVCSSDHELRSSL